MTRPAILSMVACLVVAVGLPAALIRAEHHAGGYVPREVSCPLAFARGDSPPADIVIFGSSRTGRAIDPVYISKSLSHPDARLRGSGNGRVGVERLNSTGTDLVTAVWMLEEYLRHRGKPKLVVLETMFRLKNTAGRRKPMTLFWPRHHSLLPYRQIRRFRDIYETHDGVDGLFVGLSDGFRRTTNLLHGLVKDPLGRRWDAAHCVPADMTRDGYWAWDEVAEVAAPTEAVRQARAAIQPWFDMRPPNPWKWHRKRITEAAFDVSADYRERETDLVRRLIKTANDAGIPVLMLPLVNYATVVNDGDREFFLGLGERTHWYDVYAAIGEPLTSHHLWQDPQHVRKRLSPLVSALVADEIQRILIDD